MRIELKLIADVGLVGLPNAANQPCYPSFRQLTPKWPVTPLQLLNRNGVLQFRFSEPCIIADIPGLVEGAHEGAGLGHTFLRHIERTRILLHVIDVSVDDVLTTFRLSKMSCNPIAKICLTEPRFLS